MFVFSNNYWRRNQFSDTWIFRLYWKPVSIGIQIFLCFLHLFCPCTCFVAWWPFCSLVKSCSIRWQSSTVIFVDKVLSLVVFADKVVDFSIKLKVLLAILWFAHGNLAGWGKDKKTNNHSWQDQLLLDTIKEQHHSTYIMLKVLKVLLWSFLHGKLACCFTLEARYKIKSLLNLSYVVKLTYGQIKEKMFPNLSYVVCGHLLFETGGSILKLAVKLTSPSGHLGTSTRIPAGENWSLIIVGNRQK